MTCPHSYKQGLQVYVRANTEITGVRVFLEGSFELWKIFQWRQWVILETSKERSRINAHAH